MPAKPVVLVTGADGFIGSHLTELLLMKGYSVRALAQYNSFNSHGWLEEIKAAESLEIISGDVRDPHFCKDLVCGTSLIFHLAALIAIPYSYRSPSSYAETNITGTLNMCQAARDCGNIRLIHTSTSEVYGTALYAPIDEKHPRQPQSPYSASKISADAMALSFWHAFDLPVTVARPFNTFGPRQSARAVIPTIITQIESGAKEIKLGSLTPKRDMNYVKDTVRGLLSLAECDATTGREVNICTGEEVSIGEIADMIMELMSTKVSIVTDKERIRPESSEVFRLCGDNTLIKTLTGWKPEYNLREGLRNTIEWFIKPENRIRYKPGVYNI
ncbi:MAG TPA: SDR family NAD(P)-dependent oxidoreductase [Bacteroidales bacterium]|nr:SDR family NAD(P)-dependent oxidoreductase [Bacteroidales bacterium]HPT11025.1 SDR family NAD(P)-dependent oxidoreductase [Bacteroidales bacterium]